jgi:magnesium transporter
MEDTLIFVEKALELISQRRFSALKEYVSEKEPADIAEIFEELEPEQAVILFRLLPKETAAEAFVEMDSEEQIDLIKKFSDRELSAVFSEMFFDDIADIVEEMPASIVRRILNTVSPDMRKTVNELLQYPEDSAGSIMTTEFVGLKKDMTVGDALEYIRKVAIDKETIYTCYVIAKDRHLLGYVSAKKLLTSPLDAVVGDIMDENVVSVTTTEDQEEVALLMGRYDYLAMPVVDSEGRLVGIITVDDVIDVIHEETDEDLAKMSAVTPVDTTYLKTNVFTIFKSRIPWLMILMVSATFTGMIISKFEHALAAQVVLTAFIPMLMDSGGNSGSQSSVTIIRGLSLGELEFRDIFKVLWKEVRVASLCALCLGLATFVKILLVDKLLLGNSDISLMISAVVSLTLFVTVLVAKLIGCSLPLLAKKMGFDPAVMASPFITTIVDAISLMVYFAFVTTILKL